MNQNERRMIAQTAREISDSLIRLATSLEGEDASAYGPSTSSLPWAERTLRQSLIIKELLEEGGAAGVSKERWYAIAAKYGYSGRGLAGFFRDGSAGLLDMRKNGNVVVTKKGKERLAQNLGRVETELSSA